MDLPKTYFSRMEMVTKENGHLKEQLQNIQTDHQAELDRLKQEISEMRKSSSELKRGSNEQQKKIKKMDRNNQQLERQLAQKDTKSDRRRFL